MHNRVLNFLLAPLMLLALTLGMAAPASAAQTWRPTYVSGTHVYLDPALKGGSNPVNLDGLERAYQDEAKKQGIEVFFVMTLKGDETTPGKDFARTRLDEVMGNWLGQSGFPSDHAIVCYVVRLNTDWTKSAVACNVASELAKKGLNKDIAFGIADHYSQHRTSNPDALLPQNPKGFALTLAQSFNQTSVDFAAEQVRAAQQAEAERIAAIKRAEQEKIAAAQAAERNHKILVAVEIGGPILIVLLILGFLWARKRKAFAKAGQEIASWDALFQVANSNYIELESHYLDFLKRQGANWMDKFKGSTLTRYTAAVSAYADLSARIQTAKKLLDSAKKANDSGNIFSVAGNEAAYAMLTTSDVTIDSKSLSFEQQGLFGALLDGKGANTKKPKELLDDMDNLFRTTNSTMADIMKAFEGSEQNRKDIDRLFGEVDGLKENLAAAKLSFDAYSGAYATLSKAKDAFLAILDSDPLEAYEESEQVEADAEALKAKIGKAIELRNSLASTDKAINDAAKRVSDVRGQAADYQYPDGGEAAAGASVTYLLNERGDNPDEELAEARKQFDAAVTFVLNGDLDKSSKAKANAEAKAAEAVAVVTKVLAAKDTVKKQVPIIHTALTKLVGEIPAGDDSLAALNAGFLPANFDSAPGQMKQAKKIAESTTSQLAAIKAAFFEQRYVAAAELVATVTGDIQGSRNGIIAVHTRLKELTDLRQHAKAQTTANTQTSTGLDAKIKANAFTTSAATDGKFAGLKPTLARHTADVAQAVTDWPAASAAADKLASDLKGIDGSIDTEKAAYDHAVKSLGALRQAVSGAVTEGNTNANVVRSQARNAVAQAQQILAQAETAIKVAKSDWNSLSQRFDGNTSTATAAHNAVIADKQAYNAAVRAIEDAESYVAGVEGASYAESRSGIGRHGGTFGSGVRANCSSAHSYLNNANSSLRSQNYEEAQRQAGQAKSAANSARDEAERQVAMLVAAAVALWEEEERERRRREQEEEDRRRRQREEEERQAQARRDEENRRNSSSSSSSSGSDWGGGSNSSGGGFSGSSNSSGGDFS